MTVFLIPTSTPERYELYYEAPDLDMMDGDEGQGFFSRMKRRFVSPLKRKFSDAIKEAEEWRHRRHETEDHPAGVLTRARRKVMGFVVERIAEQRLLWHLRKADEVCAQIPTDLSEDEAMTIIRTTLKKDADHHFKWLWIDFALLILVAPLMLVPGPNVPGFYFTFQVVGHYLSMGGAKHGLADVRWTIKQNAALTELRALLIATAPNRTRRIHELAERLRLQHLATFFEQVATPTA